MHNRRDFLKKSLLGAAGLAAPGWLKSAEAQSNKRPNFLFILVDDLGWKDLGCFGSSFYETPNVDRLRAGGMKFTDAYAACPVCSPTRASIMTGKYPARTGITTYISVRGHNQPERWRRNTKLLPAPYEDRMALDETTLAEALHGAGYSTFFAGKWHLGPEGYWPTDQGFDVNKGGCHWGAPMGKGRYFVPYQNPTLEDGPQGEYLPERLGRETVNFIRQHKDEPFLAYLSFYDVHIPLMTTDKLREKYEEKRESIEVEGPIWGTVKGSKVRLKQLHTVYAGMVEAMDRAVGRVLDTLDELNLDKNTVVIFMSDNGGLSTSEGHPTANVPLKAGKGWLYEGGIREPMMIRWPGVTKPGSTCHTPVISTDFYPTMLEMAGLPQKPNQHMDGKSLVPLLRGKSMDRGPLFWHFPHYGNQGGLPGAAMRDGKWKFIRRYEDNSLELYNLEKDLGEENNLVKQEAERARRMNRRLDDWLESVDARFPAPNPNYRK